MAQTNKVIMVQFREWNCIVEKRNYGNNDRVALSLEDADDGSPIATATSNWPEEDLASDEVIIKDWSENEGMVKALVHAEVIAEPHRFVDNGYVTAPVCKLLI